MLSLKGKKASELTTTDCRELIQFFFSAADRSSGTSSNMDFQTAKSGPCQQNIWTIFSQRRQDHEQVVAKWIPTPSPAFPQTPTNVCSAGLASAIAQTATQTWTPTSPMVSLTYWSIALAISALFTPVRNFMFRTRGWCLSHQLSALSPASRVQWIRDCWPAPIPITCNSPHQQWCNSIQQEKPTIFGKITESYLSIFSIADRIRLSVFESDGGHCEITDSLFRELVTTEGQTVDMRLCW